MYYSTWNVFIFAINWVPMVISQDCPNIEAPAYGSLLRPCATNTGATCYIGCPEQFDIIGSCFRACVALSSTLDYQDTTSEVQRASDQSIRESRSSFKTMPQETDAGWPGRCNGCSDTLLKSPLLTELEQMLRRDRGRRSDRVRAKQTASAWSAAWTGSATYCVNTAVTCPPVTPPTDGFIANSCPNYAGLTCQFGCTQGYRMIGSNSILCQLDGSWSNRAPSCLMI